MNTTKQMHLDGMQHASWLSFPRYRQTLIAKAHHDTLVAGCEAFEILDPWGKVLHSEDVTEEAPAGVERIQSSHPMHERGDS